MTILREKLYEAMLHFHIQVKIIRLVRCLTYTPLYLWHR
jgi:hypothetical protein